MFKPGDKIEVTIKENGVVDYKYMIVMEENDGLIKVKSGNEISVINMRSISFIKATIVD